MHSGTTICPSPYGRGGQDQDGIPAPRPHLPVDQAVAMSPDCILTGITDGCRTRQLKEQALSLGFRGEFLLLEELYRCFDIRSATLKQMARRLHQQDIPGRLPNLASIRVIRPGNSMPCFRTGGCTCLTPLRGSIQGIYKKKRNMDVPLQRKGIFPIQVKQRS